MSTYNCMEGTLHIINQKFVSLDSAEEKKNKALLNDVLSKVFEILKRRDPIFAELYNNSLFHGGSFYDGLKVGKPDEFDIDVKLKFPKCVRCDTGWRRCPCVKLSESSKPGFVWLRVEQGCLSAEIEKHFLVDGYISTVCVQRWMKSLVWKARDEILKDYKLGLSESGPAITLKVYSDYGYWICIDLVPSFIFKEDQWPGSYRVNNTGKEEFFIVPKSPKQLVNSRERYWRCSFQEQERVIMSCKEKLKPALKLLKKLRDRLVHNVPSYFLKTIVLWEADAYGGWNNNTLSEAFMKVLKDYRDALKSQLIKYYWNSNNNLFENFGNSHCTLTNYYNAIDKIIKKIDREHQSNSSVLAEILLTEKELAQFYDQIENTNSVQSLDDGPRNNDFNGGSLNQSGAGWGTVAAVGAIVGGAVLIGSLVSSFLNRNRNNNNN